MDKIFHFRAPCKALLRLFNALVVAVSFLIAGQALAMGYGEATYEVYFGDFNGDGKTGDVYYHRKDLFVLIHGEITVPIFVARDGSYVVYEGTTIPVTLDLASSALSGYVKGVLNIDYYFTDINNDGNVDIVATKGGRTTTLVYGVLVPMVIPSVVKTYQYDPLGRLVRVLRDGQDEAIYDYDDADNRNSVTE